MVHVTDFIDRVPEYIVVRTTYDGGEILILLFKLFASRVDKFMQRILIGSIVDTSAIIVASSYFCFFVSTVTTSKLKVVHSEHDDCKFTDRFFGIETGWHEGIQHISIVHLDNGEIRWVVVEKLDQGFGVPCVASA